MFEFVIFIILRIFREKPVPQRQAFEYHRIYCSYWPCIINKKKEKYFFLFITVLNLSVYGTDIVDIIILNNEIDNKIFIVDDFIEPLTVKERYFVSRKKKSSKRERQKKFIFIV